MTGESTALVVRPGAGPWLEDHRPQGNLVVAGAVLAEWLLGPGPGALRDFRFRRPLRVPDAGARVQRNVEIRFGVETVSLLAPRVAPDGTVAGIARVAEAALENPRPAGNAPEALAGSAARETSIDPTFHGPTYRVLARPVRCGPAGLDASIRISGQPPEIAPWRSGRDVRILDGMFQAAGLCRTRTGLVRGAPSSAALLRWLPTAGLDGRYEARVRWDDPASPAEMLLCCIDPHGRVVVEATGYRAEPAGFMSGRAGLEP